MPLGVHCNITNNAKKGPGPKPDNFGPKPTAPELCSIQSVSSTKFHLLIDVAVPFYSQYQRTNRSNQITQILAFKQPVDCKNNYALCKADDLRSLICARRVYKVCMELHGQIHDLCNDPRLHDIHADQISALHASKSLELRTVQFSMEKHGGQARAPPGGGSQTQTS